MRACGAAGNGWKSAWRRRGSSRAAPRSVAMSGPPSHRKIEIDPEDLEDATEEEIEAAEETVLDQATAARTIAELEAEIVTLQRLEAQARELRRSGHDRKWTELETRCSITR